MAARKKAGELNRYILKRVDTLELRIYFPWDSVENKWTAKASETSVRICAALGKPSPVWRADVFDDGRAPRIWEFSYQFTCRDVAHREDQLARAKMTIETNDPGVPIVVEGDDPYVKDALLAWLKTQASSKETKHA